MKEIGKIIIRMEMGKLNIAMEVHIGGWLDMVSCKERGC